MFDTLLGLYEILKWPTMQTLYMVALSTFFSILMGLPLGVLLCVTSAEGLAPNLPVNQVVGRTVNVFRSFPFVILMIAVIPLTRLITGSSIGTTAAIVPLSIAAAPYVARIIESALKEVDPGTIQAAKVMGSTDFTIMWKVMVPEALPALVAGVTLTIINLIGYSAMAGVIGGGGLGDVAIRYGYHRYQLDVLIGAVIVIIIMVELIQITGTYLANSMIKKR